jgi:hypothetical protein
VSGDPPPCGLGDRLSNAQQGGFFSWFCLTAVEADEPSPHPAINSTHDWQRFRPSGPRFHHLVELAVGLDPRDEAKSPATGKGAGWLFIRVGRE